MQTRPDFHLLCFGFAFALTVLLPRTSYGGEICVTDTNLGAKLTLQARQDGMPAGDPQCTAKTLCGIGGQRRSRRG
jgi:hypothetical protein